MIVEAAPPVVPPVRDPLHTPYQIYNENAAPKPADLKAQLVAPSADAYLLLDETSGMVLVEKNGWERRPPASLVKIMTALIALERGRLEDQVDVDVNYMEMPSSTVMGLLPGERISLKDLLYGLMLPSGNDAAVAVAKHIAGSERIFVDMMNRRARELGLRDTYFANPHGLDFGRYGQGYSTAYDLALLSRQAMSLPAFREIVATLSWTARGKDETYEMLNRNLLLYNYDGADGVKIGYTRRAGQTLVGSVTKNGHRVYAVVLGSQHRMTDAVRLFDYVFQRYKW